ncbi:MULTISPECIES: methylated-DNA--[protein]-cysteine S-methyltransferase [unclassified Enterococcus]|jgi:methylated-DNA-[protein]-cysteine S-methyltransferase|uniref:methylated-DNA--[protein]-cysteine S-methyltransferase n=1 Tax=unclassified Enterococcus TaxID=2608891 RepID=UPI000354153D|nr:putative methylated-DNA--[protein]-cysteine S-methyltransferase [Enterococcus faecalis 13-SD-W-01]
MKITTTIGDLWINASDKGLTRVSFSPIDESPEASQEILNEAKHQLIDYLEGKRKDFQLPLDIQVGTSFQQSVWYSLEKIPYGETRNYQEVAVSVERPKAIRAIGQANSVNPLPIVIPCHRVIGKNGKLTGYMGKGEEGLQIKKQLLALEGLSLWG